jgi:hypothetical protein
VFSYDWFQGGSFVLNDDSVNALIDKQVLIIVKKIHKVDQLSDDVVEVIRITDDIDVINQFHSNANNFTPSKVLYFTYDLDAYNMCFE